MSRARAHLLCRRSLVSGLIGACLLVLGGCYHYTPASFETVGSDMYVRASLTSQKTLELENTLGTLRTQLEGHVLERASDRDAILLAVPQPQMGDPRTSSARMRQWLWIEESDLIQVEVRNLDRRQTGLLVGVTGVVVGYFLHRAFGSGSVDTQQPPSGNGEA